MSNFVLFLPETLCLLLSLVLFFGTIVSAGYARIWAMSLVGGAIILGATLWTLPMSGEPFFEGIYRVDFFSQLVKVVLAAGFLLVVIVSREPKTLRESAWLEYPMLLALSTVGMMMLVSATELLTLYVALELSAYPLYILVALNRDRMVGSESAVKYMLQGMIASATTLFGLSYLFGLARTTYLVEIAAQFDALATMPLFWLAMLLVMAGFLFKLAAFPFHFWAPDTYQAAPHQVVTFIATASKVAAVAIIARVTALVIGDADVRSLQLALLVLCVVAMTLGNLAAIVQRDIKRLLGYSTVAHAGYVLIGVQSFSSLGLTSAIFYVIGYFAMTFLCFLVVCEVAREQNSPKIEALAGLYRRSPLLALALLVGIFGLTGLPPTVGFIGKWFLFSAALENGQFFLVLVAAINSVIALYYYMRIIRQAYLVAPIEDVPLRPTPLVGFTAVGVLIIVVWMGTAPGPFWSMARGAAGALVSMP